MLVLHACAVYLSKYGISLNKSLSCQQRFYLSVNSSLISYANNKRSTSFWKKWYRFSCKKYLLGRSRLGIRFTILGSFFKNSKWHQKLRRVLFILFNGRHFVIKISKYTSFRIFVINSKFLNMKAGQSGNSVVSFEMLFYRIYLSFFPFSFEYFHYWFHSNPEIKWNELM